MPKAIVPVIPLKSDCLSTQKKRSAWFPNFSIFSFFVEHGENLEMVCPTPKTGAWEVAAYGILVYSITGKIKCFLKRSGYNMESRCVEKDTYSRSGILSYVEG